MAKVNLIEVAENIINIAKKHNCSVQVTMIQGDSKEISLRNQKVEKLLSSVAISTGVRLFKNKKSTIIAFSGEDFDNMEEKISNALLSMDYLSEDEYKRLLQVEEFEDNNFDKNLGLSDDAYRSLNIDQIKKNLRLIETKAIEYDKRIIPSEMAEFAAATSQIHLFTSNGVKKSFCKSNYSFSYSAVAHDAEKNLRERDYWYETKRHFVDLPQLENIGKIGEMAAQRALKRLGGKKIKSGERTVIFSNRTAGSLLSLLCNAIDGEEIVIKNSFLVDQLNQKLFPDFITIVDDPFIKKYPGSYPFDGEGMKAKKKTVFHQGKLTTYLHNSYSAGKLNMKLTGNASFSISGPPHIKVGNFYLQGGKGNLEDLVQEIKDGLVVDDLFVSGMNSVTGNFSFGASGFLVENGKMTQPVKEITIAGNLLELYKNILVIADDNLWKSSISSPSFLVSKLTIGGI